MESIFDKTLKFKSNYHPTLEFIILRCLKTNPDERITWKQLFEWEKTGKVPKIPELKDKSSSSTVKRSFNGKGNDLRSTFSENDTVASNCMCSLFM